MTAATVTATVPAQASAPSAEDLSGALASYALVQRAQAGDRDAMADIYRRYQPIVFRFVRRKVGSIPLAEDLTHDTFVRALRRLNGFTWRGTDVGAWLVTIARNLVADYFKSAQNQRETVTCDVYGSDAEDRSPEGAPDKAVIDYLTSTALMTALLGLNAEQREVLVLRFLKGMPISETARVMGKNDSAIKALQYRAVRSMARLLPGGWDGAR